MKYLIEALTSWKTTLTGLALIAAGLYVYFQSTDDAQALTLTGILVSSGLALMGAKDPALKDKEKP